MITEIQNKHRDLNFMTKILQNQQVNQINSVLKYYLQTRLIKNVSNFNYKLAISLMMEIEALNI